MGKTLMHDLEHHASDKAVVAAYLALAFATMLNPVGWQVRHRGKGNNSWQIYKPAKFGDKIWRFTSHDKGAIIARNDWRYGASKLFVLETRVDVIRFANFVLKNP
jgi:hypothetical protein